METRAGTDYISSEMANRDLKAFVESHERLFVLTGAGCSTNSGIPDYRDADGSWKRMQPVRFQAFVADDAIRSRYWARSMIGWRRFGHALPNDAHHALARLEANGRSRMLLTQNVDGCIKPPGAGWRSTFTAGSIWCAAWPVRLSYAAPTSRKIWSASTQAGPTWPDCPSCGGVLKPDVVFFGESVPRDQVSLAMEALEQADAMLVVGSSLMVYSGFRFAQAAARRGIPIAAVNLGRTRADDLLTLKIQDRCEAALSFLL